MNYKRDMGYSPFCLAGRLALVTGGGSGIGFGISRALVEAGANVVITGRREDFLKQAVEELGSDRASYIVNDIRNKAGIPLLIERIESQIGAIDILVNNAGIHLKKAAQLTSDEEFDQILDTNLSSVFSLTRECARRMLPRKSGSIILLGSMAGNFGIENVVAYGTSKAALSGMMRNLVTEYSESNIRINTIAPGWIQTEMFLKATESDPVRKEKIQNRIALPGYGTPEDIGRAAVFLGSDAARYITGVRLDVDGGATINF